MFSLIIFVVVNLGGEVGVGSQVVANSLTFDQCVNGINKLTEIASKDKTKELLLFEAKCVEYGEKY